MSKEATTNKLCCAVNPSVYCPACKQNRCKDHYNYWNVRHVDSIAILVCDDCLALNQERFKEQYERIYAQRNSLHVDAPGAS